MKILLVLISVSLISIASQADQIESSVTVYSNGHPNTREVTIKGPAAQQLYIFLKTSGLGIQNFGDCSQVDGKGISCIEDSSVSAVKSGESSYLCKSKVDVDGAFTRSNLNYCPQPGGASVGNH